MCRVELDAADYARIVGVKKYRHAVASAASRLFAQNWTQTPQVCGGPVVWEFGNGGGHAPYQTP